MMKTLLAAGCLVLALHGRAVAQGGASDLDVTLPTGKVVHFQTEEQKEKFLAARAAQAARVQHTQAVAADEHPPKPFELGHTALDEVPRANGKVNPTAPTFTADYYMIAPETWGGKQITLSVAYLNNVGRNSARSDGLVQMEALTYNDMTGASFGQASGGYLTILAKPDVATRLMQQCGTRYSYVGDRVRTTMIRGEIRKFDRVATENGSTRDFGFFVEK